LCTNQAAYPQRRSAYATSLTGLRAQRRGLGMIYRKASDIASEMYKARGRPTHMTEDS
jgi:hypothetical protein